MVEGRSRALTDRSTCTTPRKRGDALAREVVRETARFLGTGIANLLNIFNPDVVVLAGGVTRAGEGLFEPLRAEVRRRAFKPAVDACRIVPGALDGAAGVVGAVATFSSKSQAGYEPAREAATVAAAGSGLCPGGTAGRRRLREGGA